MSEFDASRSSRGGRRGGSDRRWSRGDPRGGGAADWGGPADWGSGNDRAFPGAAPEDFEDDLSPDPRDGKSRVRRDVVHEWSVGPGSSEGTPVVEVGAPSADDFATKTGTDAGPTAPTSADAARDADANHGEATTESGLKSADAPGNEDEELTPGVMVLPDAPERRRARPAAGDWPTHPAPGERPDFRSRRFDGPNPYEGSRGFERPAHGGGSCRWIQVADVDSLIDCARDLGTNLPGGVLRNREQHRSGLYHPVVRRGPGAQWLLVVCPTVWYTESDMQVHTGELAILVGPDVVISLETGAAGVHDDALTRVRSAGARGSAVQRVVASLMLALVWRASRLEVSLGEAVADMERLVFDPEKTNPLQKIYDLKREISEARRALTPVAAELPELADAGEFEVVLEHKVLDRLVSTVERVDQHLDAHDDLLSDMLQVYLSQISVQQNEDMRKISAWAAIFVVPTIIAGIYGMNFHHMPELSWEYGYPFALGLIAAACGGLYWLFKRSGWM